MSQGRGALAVTACIVGLSVSSCAFRTHTSPSIPIQRDVVPPTVLTESVHAEHKPPATADRDSDCVLTTDVHLWCKRISRFY